MPTIDPRDGFEIRPPYLQQKYRGLRQEESAVLRAYLRDTGTENIRRVRTSVPVGEGEQAPNRPEPSRRQVKLLSQWKIDAVVDRPSKQEVIELKSRATHTAVGQVLAYDLALGLREDEPTTSRPTVASFRVHPDLPQFARAANVTLHQVPRADPSTATQRFLEDQGLLGDDSDTDVSGDGQ
jgi:hypothetical protein